MAELTDEQRQEILNAIKQRRKIEAIKLHREATGDGLKESKEFIEELTAQLMEEDPDSFQPAKAGCGAAMILFAAGVVSLFWSQLA